MRPLIPSLHHITATVAEAGDDLDFFRGILGLRLVKRTINFDNPGVYHFYYGDEEGLPASLMTTFPYAGWGVPTGVHGAGQITATSFSVPPGSLEFWRARITERGLSSDGAPSPFGEPRLRFTDHSGLVIQLVESEDDPRKPWISGGIGADAAIRGVHGVTMTVREARRSVEFLTEILAFEVVGRAGNRTRVATGTKGPGTLVEVIDAPDAPSAVNGMGTVHHVAFAIEESGEQLRVRDELIRLGFSVTEVKDRQYFESIYFREPGGVLYEIATVGPGFLVDEEATDLGRSLRLPPWEEPRRVSIEERLPSLPDTG